MKHILATLAALLLALSPAQATNIDSWTNYLSYYDATEVVEADGVIYSVMSGNLMAYDTHTTEVQYIDRINSGLSAKGIQLLGYSKTQHSLVIVYKDGNIDLYSIRTGEVWNLPQFHDNPDNDFALNKIRVYGDNAYIATNEGFLIISVKDKILKGRFPIGATYAVTEFNGQVYAATMEGQVMTIGINDNMLDRTQWKLATEKTAVDLVASDTFLYFTCLHNDKTEVTKDYGIWVIRKDGVELRVTAWAPSMLNYDHGRLVGYGSNILAFATNSPLASSGFFYQKTFNSITPASDGGYWVARNGEGIVHHVQHDNEFVADANPIHGDGPQYELPYFLDFCGDRLFMAAGRLDPLDRDNRPYYAAWRDSDDDEWHKFEEPYGGDAGTGPWLRKNHDFENVSSIAQDPFDPTHHFVTSGRQGLFEYRNGKLVKQYTEGSPAGFLRSCSGSRSYDYVRTSGAVFDKEGNLFLANSGGGGAVDTIIWCLKRDGTIKGFFYPTISDGSCFEKSLIDQKGRLWFTQFRTAGMNAGFLCMDFNGTLDNTKDDVYTYRTSFTNQDGTGVSFQQALAIAEDKTGRIWLGTETGLYVVDNPDEWSSPDFLITQVKVPRPDGIYADYLLSGTPVSAIAVDGANRKWIGTAGDGVYLVSDDGVTLIHHFTKSNSPLISDIIWSIACHPKNGEVFIGTDVGLVSYHSDASEAEESLSRDNLRVYPNPVRPDYSGPVVLDGLVYDSDVKVVSSAGHTVAAGTSVGGTFTWNGRGPSGERVGSGIYYFMVASPDGKESTVAKVAIVR